MEPTNEPHDDTSVPLASAAQATNNEWLTLILVLICRAFLAVVVAFAKAILVIACDAEAGIISSARHESFTQVCSSLMDEICKFRQGTAQQSTVSSPQESGTRFSTGHANQIGCTQETTPVFSRPMSRASTGPRCYVITTGLDVGITTIREVVTNLTSGVHDNVQQLCNSRAEAMSCYLSALKTGNVRRICIRTSNSGQTEHMIEVLPDNGEIPDLDQQLAISASSILKELSEPIYGFSSNAGAGASSLSSWYVFGPSVATKSEYEPDGLMMPSEWTYTTTAKTPANTPNSSPVVHSRTMALYPVLSTGPSRLYTLDSDEESSSASRDNAFVPGIEDEDDAQSSRSSDMYYNSSLDLAIAEHIRHDDEALGIINAFDDVSA